jgi:hypothetical protein
LRHLYQKHLLYRRQLRDLFHPLKDDLGNLPVLRHPILVSQIQILDVRLRHHLVLNHLVEIRHLLV